MVKDLFDKPISNVELSFSDQNKILNLNLGETNGKTSVTLKYRDKKNEYVFKLKKNRKIDRKVLDLIKKDGILAQIN